MQLDVVNAQNEKVGAVDLRDDVFGGRVNTDLIWESVVRANAAERRGTHATKNRALVSGSGKKPWRQKGTGRARVGEIAQPAVAARRHRVRAAAAQLRLPAAEEGRARRAARGAGAEAARTAQLVVVDALTRRRDQDQGGGGAAEAARRQRQGAARRRRARRQAGAVGAQHPRRASFVPSGRRHRARRDERDAMWWRRAARSRSCRKRSPTVEDREP